MSLNDQSSASQPAVAQLAPANSEVSAFEPLAGELARCGQTLQRSFHTEFQFVEVNSGRTVAGCTDGPSLEGLDVAELYREVARRQVPEFVAEEFPLVVLAVPMPESVSGSHVALAPFLTEAANDPRALETAANRLGLDADATAQWAAAQDPWPARALLRIAELVVDKLATEPVTTRLHGQVARLQEEVEQITTHLVGTYEEISLLHRLTRNLKISSSDADLGRFALKWLADTLPAQGLAIHLIPAADAAKVNSEGPREPMVLTHGDCPLEADRFDDFVAWLVQHDGNEPIVANRAVTGQSTWDFARVQEVIATPIGEGDHTYGWLMAFNHSHDEEFGTGEASLISSVATILGIHRSNIELYQDQAELLAGVVRALTSAIDAKDPYTCGHSDRVARVAVRLAQELDCDEETLNTLYLSGLLHDVGKIGIDDNVLRKPGKLTEAEFEHIKLHPELGHKILRDLKQLDQVLPVVLHHHEAWNGKGYPGGLAGDEIPLAARIVALADSFDAMSSDRPYRKGMPYEKLEQILQGGAGEQWDAAVVDAYFRAREDIYEIAARERENLNLDAHQWR